MPRPIARALRPYWTTSDGDTVKLYHGDVTEVLRQLPSQSVHMVVTSPPYWGLRDYQTDKSLEIGSEKTPQEFVEKMVKVFREVRRVLRDDGTVWLNLGDTYGAVGNRNGLSASTLQGSKTYGRGCADERRDGFEKPMSGNLVGIPWRVALALQEDGWILRQDIVWHKPSPMPESVKNRCTKSHEYVFLLAKRMGYFYDDEAIKEKSVTIPHKLGWVKSNSDRQDAQPENEANQREWGSQTSNKRSVWTVSSHGYSGSHFAVFPPKLIEPCILAGTSEKGCCAECRTPWKRIVEERKLVRDRPNDYVKRTGEKGTGNSCSNCVAGVEVKTIGWKPTCSCDAGVIPCVVLDPFIGSGTTCCVAIAHGRRSIGIDLKEKYLRDNAIPRIEGELLKRPSTCHLIRREVKAMDIGRTIS